ncbi:hypothetical protein CAC42_7405 [Sphaceloma murrayae]|uniref:DNA/RNA-binding protein Alba-like domain-containing protein n=1 Tax=Sphaceloma murrayae TaxID=2082308 RepID=A0A2K1QWY3_9PEZI|nr:hypothetical protein CAC42_7405 [Sphaceloma murrayae]
MVESDGPGPNALADILAAHNTVTFKIAPGNKVTDRTSSVLKSLKSVSNGDAIPEKPPLVCLHARGDVANKLVTVTEIVKRQLASEGTKVYQYSVLGSEMVKTKQKADGQGRGVSAGRGGDDDAGEEVEDADAFEVMGGKEKVRNMPILTVYLVLAPIQKLKRLHGEQTNMPEP